MLKNFFIDSDNLLTIEGVKNLLTLAYVNDATVTGQLKDTDRVNVPSVDPVTLNYVAGSDGNYKGVLPRADTLSTVITEGVNYIMSITIVKDTSQSDLDIVLRAGRRIFRRSQP